MILSKPQLMHLTLFTSECRVLIKQMHWDRHTTTRESTSVEIRRIRANVAKHLSLLWLTHELHDSSQTSACLEESYWIHTHTVSFITPQGAILCTAEIWWLPSLINVQAAPINIFISAYAPCWKPIQGDFKLYELIPYLLRQLSMPTPSLNTSFLPPSSSPVLISSLPPPHHRFLHTAEMGFEHLGFTRRATSLED